MAVHCLEFNPIHPSSRQCTDTICNAHAPGSHFCRSWTTRSSPSPPAVATHLQGTIQTVQYHMSKSCKETDFPKNCHPTATPSATSFHEQWTGHRGFPSPPLLSRSSRMCHRQLLKYLFLFRSIEIWPGKPQESVIGNSWNISVFLNQLVNLRRKAGRRNIRDWEAIWLSWSVRENIRFGLVQNQDGFFLVPGRISGWR